MFEGTFKFELKTETDENKRVGFDDYDGQPFSFNRLCSLIMCGFNGNDEDQDPAEYEYTTKDAYFIKSIHNATPETLDTLLVFVYGCTKQFRKITDFRIFDATIPEYTRIFGSGKKPDNPPLVITMIPCKKTDHVVTLKGERKCEIYKDLNGNNFIVNLIKHKNPRSKKIIGILISSPIGDDFDTLVIDRGHSRIIHI